MPQRSAALPILLWVAALAFLPLWPRLAHHPVLWDLDVYRQTILSLRAGHDPYADGIAAQLLIRDHTALQPSAMPPYTYPYSPITLPLVRWIAQFPLSLTGALYLLLCAAGVGLSVYVCLQFAEPEERRTAILLSPLVLFLPGLIRNFVVLSGNIAYPIYGLVLPAALLGWRRNRWLCFYIAVVLASCIKAPLLLLLAIPVLSARRQWLPAATTAAVGVGLFALQPHLWPALFHNYLTAVELQFSLNHDFGASPAGILADTLFDTVPYKTTTTVIYLLYAIPIALLLLYLRNRFLAGSFSQSRWVPVLILGVTLLNPRIMEYDIAPITLLMALAAWRILSRYAAPPRRLLFGVLFLLAINAFPLIMWRPIECATLGVIFFLGVHDLLSGPGLTDDRPRPASQNLSTPQHP